MDVFETLLANLPGVPEFRIYEKLDVNPLSGAQKKRLIHVPNEAMITVQKRVIDHMRRRNYPTPNATGVRKGFGIAAHLSHHLDQRYFYLLDISKAYDSVDLASLAILLCEIDPDLRHRELEMYQFLLQYCQSKTSKGLATGANASPILFDYYAARLIDERLRDICARFGLLYTRYLDDLLLSHKIHPIGQRKRRSIREVIHEADFDISHSKARVLDIARGPIYLNGIGMRRWSMDGKTELFVPPWYLRKIEKLCDLVLQGEASENQLHGLMSVFWGVVRTRPASYLTGLERATFKKYRSTIRELRQGFPF